MYIMTIPEEGYKVKTAQDRCFYLTHYILKFVRMLEKIVQVHS